MAPLKTVISPGRKFTAINEVIFSDGSYTARPCFSLSLCFPRLLICLPLVCSFLPSSITLETLLLLVEKKRAQARPSKKGNANQYLDLEEEEEEERHLSKKDLRRYSRSVTSDDAAGVPLVDGQEKLQELVHLPRTWTLARLTIPLEGLSKQINRLLEGCFQILATNQNPETHNGRVVQTATHLTWILAEYLADTIAWLMRSILAMTPRSSLTKILNFFSHLSSGFCRCTGNS